MNDSAVCPPNPTKVEEQYRDAGHQVLRLVRSLEKEQEGEDETGESAELDSAYSNSDLFTLIRWFQFLIPLVARHGLLFGDTATALKKSAEGSELDNIHEPALYEKKNDKKRSKSRSSNFKSFASNNVGCGSNVPGVFTCAEQIVGSMTRILGGQQQSGCILSKCLVGLQPEDQLLLILLASDLCTAIATFVQQGQRMASPCVVAEYELLASNAKSLLIGLTNSMDYALCCAKHSTIANSEDTTNPVTFPIEGTNPVALSVLRACHRAAVSLVSLLGARLSRFPTQIQHLLTVGVWKSVSVLDPATIESGTLLYATIQATGAMGGVNSSGTAISTNPSTDEPWGTSLQESVALLFLLLRSVVPINPRFSELAQQKEAVLHTAAGKASFDVWLHGIRSADSEEDRTKLFLHCVQVLLSMTTSLLSVERVGWHDCLGEQVDIVSIFDLAELLISFPITAESAFFGTKKRLRRETMEIGQFSPAAITNLANRVKIMGHDLLDTILSSLGFSVLIPFARRLSKICYGSLLTSSSTALRNVLEDKVLLMTQDRAQKRWLNSSIPVRTAAMESVERALLVVGTEPCHRSRSMAGTLKKGGDLDRLVTVICGCLVEQLQWCARLSEKADDWGSFRERIVHLVAAGNGLGACLVAGGPFLSNLARSLIDSTAEGFLIKCVTIRAARVEDFSPVFRCALNLGIQSCSMPWPDGESSSLGPCLRQAARELQRTTSQQSVLQTALTAIRICDTIDTPRVPALNIITKKDVTTNSRSIFANVQLLERRLEEEMLTSKQDYGAKTHEDEEKEAKVRKIDDGTTLARFEGSHESATQAANSATAKHGPFLGKNDEIKASELTEQAQQSSDTNEPVKVAQARESSHENELTIQPSTQSKDDKPHLHEEVESSHKHPQVIAKPKVDERKDEDDDIPMIYDAPPDEEDE
ncbi:hypothetical protein ACA910_003175 [Epithemia clementina (nom. ined.)]